MVAAFRILDTKHLCGPTIGRHASTTSATSSCSRPCEPSFPLPSVAIRDMTQKAALAWPAVEASFVVGALALLASLTLGGATRSGFLGDALLQLLAVPLLIVTIAQWTKYESGKPGTAASRMAL